MSRSPRPTLKDIAIETGTSISTVSRILSKQFEKYSYAAETVERVEATAKKIGYRPNIFAQSLKSSRSRFIGVSLYSLTPPKANSMAEWLAVQPTSLGPGQLMAGISWACAERGFFPVMLPRFEKPNVPLPLEAIHPDIVDGVIYERVTQGHSEYRDLMRQGRNVVIAGSHEESQPVYCVQVDAYGGMRELTAHAIEQGARDLVLISDVPMDAMLARKRVSGFRDAIEAAGLPDEAGSVFISFSEAQMLDFLMTRLTSSTSRPDCIISFSRDLYRVALHAIDSLGLRMPQDVMVGAYGSHDIHEIDALGITSQTNSLTEMGYRAAELLIDIIMGNVTKPETRVVPTELMIRRSTDRSGTGADAVEEPVAAKAGEPNGHGARGTRDAG